MVLVVTYDVDTTDLAGARRLRRVARLCERYGSRVQNSVFEVQLDPAQLIELKTGLLEILRPETDSVRLYRLGKNYQSKIEILGVAGPVELGEPLLV